VAQEIAGSNPAVHPTPTTPDGEHLNRFFPTAVLLALAVAVLVACGSSGAPADLLAARQTMLLYPASEARGTGKPPPGFYQIDHPRHFAADATYFVPVSDEHDAIQQFFKTELPKAGWTVEDPPVLSQDDQLASHCQTPGFVTCESYTKDNVRTIIVTMITLSFGGGGREGSNYHIHLERK
jgi:hypothetical protein